MGGPACFHVERGQAGDVLMGHRCNANKKKELREDRVVPGEATWSVAISRRRSRPIWCTIITSWPAKLERKAGPRLPPRPLHL